MAWLRGLNPTLAAAIVSAVVSLVVALITSLVAPTVKYGFDKRLERRKLELTYTAEQSKALRDRIGFHKGTILAAAEELAGRIGQYHDIPQASAWLQGPGGSGYYKRSFVYRVLTCWSALDHFSRGAVYIDAEVATKGDWAFAKAIKLGLDAWSEVRLFDGLNYDASHSTDHFFRGQIARLVDNFRDPETDAPLTWSKFEQILSAGQNNFTDVFSYLTSEDLRSQLKYQRLMAAYLVLVATINSFGYDYQRISDTQIENISRDCMQAVRGNLLMMVERLSLEKERGFRDLVKILKNN
jgi:hypothetical protein